MSDPRAGLPGASQLEQLFLCPGSWRAQQGLPEEPREDAETGRRIHQWLAGAPVALTPAEAAVAHACQAQRRQLLRPLAAAPDPVEYVEHRFWLRDEFGHAAMSGQADYATVRGRRALLIDYKTGRGGVTASPRNPQLMALAVMLAEERPELEEILTAIVQPALADAPGCAVYDPPALARARATIGRALATARAGDAPLRAGPRQCQYCRAKARCPAARALIETLALRPAPAAAEPVGNDQLAQWLERCGAAEQVIEALRVEARRRLAEGQDIPGWTLKPGAWRERVTDAPGVFARLAARGVTAAEFAAICAVTKTALKTLLQEKTGARGPALAAALDAVLDGLTEAKPAAPTLTRV
jgi:hypothetical protein